MTSRQSRPGTTEKVHTYSIYGLRMVADRHLDGLASRHNPDSQTVKVWFGRPQAWAAGATSGPKQIRFQSGDALGEAPASVRVWRYSESGAFHFSYRDEVEFIVDRTGRNISVRCGESSSPEDAASYLVGTIMGFAIRLMGRVALHGSTVAIGNQAVVLLGDAGCGKSTTAAAFAENGYEILTDDVSVPVELEGEFLVEPGYPGIRLWPDSVEAIFGYSEALPKIAHDWDKRYLDLSRGKYRFVSTSRPIRAFYWLGDAPRNDGAPSVKPLSPSDLMMKLVSASYPGYLLDADMRSDEFDILARLAAEIPGRIVRSRGDFSSLRDMCRVIEEDTRELGTPH